MNHNETLKDTVFSVLPSVSKPARYVGGELNMIRKNPGSTGVTVCLAFPDIYDIGQSYIGFHILYHILNGKPGIMCERAFAPWPDMEEIMRSKHIPLWSLENFLPVSSFDVVGFTLQYELHFTAVLNMLDLAGIPLRARERSEADPLILGGGTCVVNPEPVADFFDAFLLGDGEEAFPEILTVVERCKKDGADRSETLGLLAGIEGVYVPSLYQVRYDDAGSFAGVEPLLKEARIPVRSRYVDELRPEYYPRKPLVPLCEVVHDRLAVEIMRGCTRGCRFCSAGMSYRPWRYRQTGDVVTSVVRGIQSTGWDEVSLVSLSTTDYPRLENVVDQIGKRLGDKAVTISLSSLRADNFSLKMAEATAGGRKTGLTFAVEAGTQRLRDVINKNLTEEQLFATVRDALDHGFRNIKLYFMVGLPTETEDDVLAIADLLTRLGGMAKHYKGRRINVTLSPFSPKPDTPFQWEPQDSVATTMSKLKMVSANLRTRVVQIKEGNPLMSVIECRLARGGREMNEIVHNAWKRGCRLDGWSEFFDSDIWTGVFNEAGIDLAEGGGAMKPGTPLPWGHLHYGVDERYLIAELEKSKEGLTTSDCRENCGNCGPYASFCNALSKTPRDNTSVTDDTVIAPSVPAGMYGRKKKPAVRRDSVPVPGTRMRLKYSKNGTNRFVGHLDMVRIFDRTMRRAGIPVAYSQGFHPHPKISFGHPLPLGMKSVAEYADITLSEPFSSIESNLKRGMPDGLDPVGLITIPDRASSLTKVVTFSEYFVRCGIDETIDSVLNEILSRESIPVTRITKKGEKIVDIRRGIESIKVSPDRSGFTMMLSTESDRAVKPTEVLELIFPENPVLDVTRTEQYAVFNGEFVSPLEIMW